MLSTTFLAHVRAALCSTGDSTPCQLWDRPWAQDLFLYSQAPSLLWAFPQTHSPLALTQRFITSLAAHPFLLTNFFIWEHSLNATRGPDISTASEKIFSELRKFLGQLYSRRLLSRALYFLLLFYFIISIPSPSSKITRSLFIQSLSNYRVPKLTPSISPFLYWD